MTEIRDRELGAALRELDVPEHGAEFDAELQRRLEQRRPRRRAWMLAAAAAFAVLVASALALFVPRGTGVASAADVRRAVAEALAAARSVSGVIVVREEGGKNRWRFVLSSSGSFRITGLGTNNPTDLSYDATENVEYYSDLGYFTRRVGLAPGWPDSGAAEWVVQRGLGSVVATLAAGGEATVEETDYQGRSAWVLRTPTGNPGEERLITVDRETGIPVRDVQLREGRFGTEWRIEDLSVDGAPPDTGFRQRPTPEQQVTEYDMGFRRMGLDAVSRAVGYEPLAPTWLPSGYELAEVGVAQASRPTGDEQRQNPPSRNVVSLRYQRGLDQIVVTTRLTGSDPARWGDPVIGSSVRAREPERADFESGALRGGRGELVIDPNSVPHIWAIAGPLVVTIAGNADREELLRIAESLER